MFADCRLLVGFEDVLHRAGIHCGAVTVTFLPTDLITSHQRAELTALIQRTHWTAYSKSQDVAGIICLGLVRRAVLRGVLGDSSWFQWPGFAYLQYGFSRDEFIAAAQRVVHGAKNVPLAGALVPSVGEILRATENVRHWLEKRVWITELALDDFHRAAAGEGALDRRHLRPGVAIPRKNREMLKGLWAFKRAIRSYAPQNRSLDDVKRAIAAFAAHWQALERLRASCRAAEPCNQPALLLELAKELEDVRTALAAAIKATCSLDEALMRGGD